MGWNILGQMAQDWHSETRGIVMICLAFLALIGMAVWWLRR